MEIFILPAVDGMEKALADSTALAHHTLERTVGYSSVAGILDQRVHNADNHLVEEFYFTLCQGLVVF